MHKIKIALIVFMGFYCTIAYSQSIKFGLQTGYGSYKMDELKWLTSSAYKDLPFQSKIISNYPSYLYYKPSISLTFNRLCLGVQLAKYSTGSRISSKDYSGEYLFDTKINGIAPSIYFDYGHFLVLKKIKISPFLETGIIFSKFEIKEYFTLNNEEITNNTYNLKSKNYIVESGIKMEYVIYKFLSAELNSSYSAQFGKKNLKTDEDGIISGKNGAVRPDWGGFRIGLSIFVSFPLKVVK